MDWSSGALPKKRRVDAPVSQASRGLLESPAMFHREAVGDILGDDGLRMMEGAMEGLVEEQVASSSDDVVGENMRITSDEDSGDTQVTDAASSSASTSISAGSSSLLLTPIKLPESNGEWLLGTTISRRRSSRHSWIQSLWLAYLLFVREARIGIIRCITGKLFDVGLRRQRPREDMQASHRNRGQVFCGR